MNPLGVNLKDVWTDIPPVRHWKFKSRNRRSNALSTKILDRVVEMTTEPGDLLTLKSYPYPVQIIDFKPTCCQGTRECL